MSTQRENSILYFVGENAKTHVSKLRNQLSALADGASLPFTFEFHYTTSYREAEWAVEGLRPHVCFLEAGDASADTLSNLFVRIQKISGFPAVLIADESCDRLRAVQLGAGDYLLPDEIEIPTIVRFAQLSYTLRKQWDSSPVVERDTSSLSPVELLETTLRNTEARFHTVVESMSEGLGIFTRDGELVYCNTRFAELIGYRREDLYLKKAAHIFFPDGTPEQEAFIEEMSRRYKARMRGVSENYEAQVYHKNGERIWLEISAGPFVGLDGTTVGSIGAITNITERKSLEQQLRWSQKMEAVGRLAGGVAHDFNNLLTSIYGYTEMIQRKLSKSDPNYDKIEIIRKSTESATALTRQLLTISRRDVVQPRVLMLDDEIREHISLVKGLIGQVIELEEDISSSLPPVEFDAAQIQQILMNLAINARDAMPDGGKLKVSVFEKNLPHGLVTTRASLNPGTYVVLAVEDTGNGMDEHVLSHLFEPFFTTKAGKGSGLGLSTTYAIVRHQSGEILVSSEPGKGSRFEVYFPAADRPYVAQEQTQLVTVPAEGTETILVAEDEESVRELVSEVLEEFGYTVLQASDGAEALEIAANTTERIDLLLSDVVMPHVNGIELTKRLKKDMPDIKVILMSGYADDSTIPDTIQKLGAPFLPKPFSPISLTQTLRMVLDSPKVANA